jgi:site-specific DNA recombinase
MMGKGVIYARVSTEKQKERHTIASQLSILPELMKQKAFLQVQEPYIDDGISRETIDERPGMIRLLEDAERGLFDAVFVIDIDRLTRAKKSIDWEIIKDVFRKNRVVVITPSQQYNFEDEDQEFISDLFSRISAYEKKKILRRMLRGKMEKAKQGKFFGGNAPYGYTWDKTTKQYEIVESEAEVIRLMFSLCIQGLSTEKIPEYLNSLGYPIPSDLRGYKHNRKSKYWCKPTVRGILTRSMYAGEFIRWRQTRFGRKALSLRPQDEWIVAKSPAIITKEIFDLAQEALRSRKVFSTRNSKREYLLSGLIYCESCGCKMTGECCNPGRKSNKEYMYYACWNARRRHLGKECPSKSIRIEDIENSVWEEIKKLLKTPTMLKEAILRSESIDSSDETIEDLTRLLENKETEEERLLDLYQIGKFDMEKLQSRMEKLRKEKATVRKNIDALKDRNKLDTRLRTINELKIELESNIDSFDFEKKRKVLKILLWGKPGVGIFVKPDYSVDIRGLVDFSKLSDIDRTGKVYGIENASLQHHNHRPVSLSSTYYRHDRAAPGARR